MRSKLIPGRIRPISFTLPVLLAIITIILAQSAFNYIVNERLKHLESIPTKVVIEPQTVITEEVEPIYLLDGYERTIVENTVMAEASGEGLGGMEAVAQVIANRSALWNMTPAEVVSQPGQFATYDGTVSEECRLAVSNVFDFGVRPINGNVTHFYSGDVEPYWTADKECRGILRDHKFYY